MEWHPTRRNNDHTAGGIQQPLNQRGNVEMLGVVHHEQRSPRCERLRNIVVGGNADCLCYRPFNEPLIAQRGQRNEEHPIRKLLDNLSSNLERKPRLPAPTSARQRQQAMPRRDQRHNIR
jgi:hypothetical protein